MFSMAAWCIRSAQVFISFIFITSLSARLPCFGDYVGAHDGGTVLQANGEADGKRRRMSDVQVPGRIVIVKLGGSSITDKSKFEQLNSTMLEWVASNLEAAQKINNSTRFIVVHGAGSFGHHTAKQYGLKGHDMPPPVSPSAEFVDDSDKTISHIMEGLAHTRLSVTRLNWEVVRILLSHGVKAVGVSPYSFGLEAYNHENDTYTYNDNTSIEDEATTHFAKNREIETMISVIENSIQNNLVPVLHGDAVLYGQRNAGILSGDTLVSILARHLYRRSMTTAQTTSADQGIGIDPPAATEPTLDIFFMTDVDGVYTSDPNQPEWSHNDNIEGRPDRIPIIEIDQNGNVLPIESSCRQGERREEGDDEATTCDSSSATIDAGASQHTQDVTGGLKLKLQSAVDIVHETGLPVYIVKCGSKEAEQLLQGDTDNLAKGTQLQRATIIP
jgi:isopentenyl phosphate kinase